MKRQRSGQLGGNLAWHWGECCSCWESSEIGGANVTVSRTHTGFSLYFQIISYCNLFEAKKGKALFSNTYETQRISCLPMGKISGV